MTEPGAGAGSTGGTTRQTGDTELTSQAGIGSDDRELLHGGTASPADGSATADADHPGLAADGDPGDTTAVEPESVGSPPQALPAEGMGTGSDEGEPGRRRPVLPGDAVGAAVEDDSPVLGQGLGDGSGPLNDQPEPGGDGDGLDPQFREP